MASALANQQCDLCKKRKVTKNASAWCFECNESLCPDCLQIHGVIDILKDHKPIPIDDYYKLQPAVTAIQYKCDQHGIKYDLYCVDHDAPICVKCVPETHKSCCNIKSLSEVTENVKDSFLFTDLQERASDIKAVVENIIKEVSSKHATVKDETSRAISIVEATRKAINQHLDLLQEEVIKEIRTQENNIQDKISKILTTLQGLLGGARRTLDNLSQAERYASNFHTYCGIKHWNDEIRQEETELMSLQKNLQYFERFDIKINQKLANIKEDIKEFASIKPELTQSAVRLPQKEQQCQKLVVKEDIILSNARLMTLPTDKKPMNVFGCCIMASGSMIFTDFNNGQLIHLDVEGRHIKDTKLSVRPYDVVEVDDHAVAVTSPWDKKLVLVNINQGREVRTVYEGEWCNGLCFRDGKFFVVVRNRMVKVISMDGTVMSSIETENYITYCCVKNNQLYYVQNAAGIVYCCDITGKVKWKYTCDKGDSPIGITVDNKENVLVSCRGGNKIICIDKTGKESKVLLSEKDGLNKPRAITYNRKHNSLLVANMCDGKCFIYNTS